MNNRALPENNAIVDLASIPLELAEPRRSQAYDYLYSSTYRDSVVDGLGFYSRDEGIRIKSEWFFTFARGFIYLHWILGTYPEMSVEDARNEALGKLDLIKTQMLSPTDEECTTYDLALIALKAGNGRAEADVVRGFTRIAQVPHELGKDIIMPPHELPPSEILRMPVSALDLSGRSCNAIASEGVNTIAHLLLLSDAALLRTPNFGRKSLKEVRSALTNVLKNNTVVGPVTPSLPLVMALQHKILAHLEEQAELMKAVLATLSALEAARDAEAKLQAAPVPSLSCNR